MERIQKDNTATMLGEYDDDDILSLSLFHTLEKQFAH